MVEAELKGGAIVIRVPVKNVPLLVEAAWAVGSLDMRYRVTNRSEFVDALVSELNQEDEEGTTLIHRMFDKAINHALENGADGIEEHEEQSA